MEIGSVVSEMCADEDPDIYVYKGYILNFVICILDYVPNRVHWLIPF